MSGDGLADVAAAGDRLRTLEALRDRLARQIDAPLDPKDLAPLSRRLEAVLEQIDGLVDDDSDLDDELSARRAERLAQPKAASS